MGLTRPTNHEKKRGKRKRKKDKIRRGLARNGTAKTCNTRGFNFFFFFLVYPWTNRSRSARFAVRFEVRFAVDAVPFRVDDWEAGDGNGWMRGCGVSVCQCVQCVKSAVLGKILKRGRSFCCLLLYFCFARPAPDCYLPTYISASPGIDCTVPLIWCAAVYV